MYLLRQSLDQLMLAKDNDHFQSILTYQNRRGLFEMREIEEMCQKMKRVLVDVKMEKDDFICEEEGEIEHEKTKQILDIFISGLRNLEQ